MALVERQEEEEEELRLARRGLTTLGLVRELHRLTMEHDDATDGPSGNVSSSRGRNRLARVCAVDLSRNRLRTLPPSLETSLPNIKRLVLRHNALSSVPHVLLGLGSSGSDSSGSGDSGSDSSGSDSSDSGSDSSGSDSGSDSDSSGSDSSDSDSGSGDSSGSATTTGSGGLECLDLSHNGLSELPADIAARLPLLRSLRVNDNQLSTLPVDLSPWRQMTLLDLSSQRLLVLPDTLGHLPALQHLDVSHNQLGTLPDTLGRLGSLQLLDLSHNRLSTLPSSIGRLQSLLVLRAAGNRIEHVPVTLSRLRAVEVVDLSRNLLCVLNRKVADFLASKNTLVAGNPFDWPSTTTTSSSDSSDSNEVDTVFIPTLVELCIRSLLARPSCRLTSSDLPSHLLHLLNYPPLKQHCCVCDGVYCRESIPCVLNNCQMACGRRYWGMDDVKVWDRVCSGNCARKGNLAKISTIDLEW